MNDVNVQETNFVLVGLNTTGRALALMLGVLGAKRITLVDDKVVSGTEQGYMPIDVGLKKTEAVKDTLAEICSTEVVTVNSLDAETMESLSSNLDGNMVVAICEPVGVKTKVHICRNLHSACKAIYFVTFYEDGEPLVLQFSPHAMQNVTSAQLESLPDGKPGKEGGRTAAAQVLSYITACERDLNLS